jgi:lipopolysaccharide heptosyltransferase II
LKILIIALSGIGDALLFTPAASLVRKNFPHIKMDALVMFKSARDIYEQSGLFNKVIFHDFLHESLTRSFRMVLSLRKKYDVSINVYPSNRKEYNLIQFLIGAKKRAAIKYLHRDLFELGLLNNVRIMENNYLHNVQENIRICEKVLNFTATETPDLVLPIDSKLMLEAKRYLANEGIKESNTIVGIHAGSATFKNQMKRRWEPEKFAELTKLFSEIDGAYVLLFGGPDETNLKTKIRDLSGAAKVLIPPDESILITAALIKSCDVFVTNDSGLMHVASAVKTPTIGIIGPTNSNYIHPWHTSYEIASLYLECSPCFYYSPRPLTCHRTDVKFKCIKELSVELVYKKALKFLKKTS